jgi:hypothetical protein
MGRPESAIDTAKCGDINYIATYTNEICNVGNFIQPAIDSWLVGDVIQIRSVNKLLDFSRNSSFVIDNYILDIDIDFWSDHLPSKEEIQAVQALYTQASTCTIALSPYFINIEKALRITKMLFSK